MCGCTGSRSSSRRQSFARLRDDVEEQEEAI
jgi:hypothetical protein